MKVILENKEAEIVEKKSRFISNVFYVDSEDIALEYLQNTKKKYYDAKHWCYAYIIGKDGSSLKSSDDGEPQGTAGHPMLDILKGMELTNVLAIVTRYFGGTLLGTGGLVRAYSEALKKSLVNINCTNIINGYKINFSINYDDYGKLEKAINKFYRENNKVFEIKKEFTDNIKLEYLVVEEIFDKFNVDLINISKGEISLNKDNKLSYYIVGKDGKYIWKTL